MVDPLLDPVLIAIMPRWSEAVRIVSEIEVSHAVALAEDEAQAIQFRENWSGHDDHPLLLVRCSPENTLPMAVETVTQIATRSPNRAIGILLADGPDAPGFKESRRRVWNQDFAKSVSGVILDVQILEYSPSWATHRPRIR